MQTAADEDCGWGNVIIVQSNVEHPRTQHLKNSVANDVIKLTTPINHVVMYVHVQLCMRSSYYLPFITTHYVYTRAKIMLTLLASFWPLLSPLTFADSEMAFPAYPILLGFLWAFPKKWAVSCPQLLLIKKVGVEGVIKGGSPPFTCRGPWLLAPFQC